MVEDSRNMNVFRMPMDPHGSSIAQFEEMKVYLYMTAGSRYYLRTCHSGTVIRATVFEIMRNMELIS